MMVSDNDGRAGAILLDVEGTTTPVDFVYQTLFPYARSHVEDFLAAHFSSEEVRADVLLLRAEYEEDLRRGLGPPLWEDSAKSQIEAVVTYVKWLMDQDRKSTGLKSLQGKIWQRGYQSGQLLGVVFQDIAPAFKRWQSEGKKVCIYSSGSVLAQKLLFANSTEGDLTGFIDEYFDTGVGSKLEAESYRRISVRIERPPGDVLFISDTIAELDAARLAGMRTMCSIRPGNRPLSSLPKYQSIRSFDEVVLK